MKDPERYKLYRLHERIKTIKRNIEHFERTSCQSWTDHKNADISLEKEKAELVKAEADVNEFFGFPERECPKPTTEKGE